MSASRLSLVLLLVTAGSASAQFTPPSVTATPPTTYGAQPYNPAAPTGFNHPNDTGFGSYHNPTRLKGHRTAVQNQRRYRGY